MKSLQYCCAAVSWLLVWGFFCALSVSAPYK